MISKSTIDKVNEAARVEEVIGDFVQLKKSGANYKGLSPFSDERTPSFMVSPAKQIWKDFSSGKGGNAIAFVMEHEHFTYPEAIKYLAKKYNIEVEETVQTDEQKQLTDERESMYLVSDFAQKYFENTLWESHEGKAIGLTYFKERGFTQDTIKTFGLGYNPNDWDALTKEALKQGYQLQYLEKTGLTIVKGLEDGSQRTLDRFKGRVMFPIHSMSGRVLGFGGRILVNDKKAAKYLNSPESEIYHKSKVLFGLYFAKQAIAKENNCYLVEGYTDVIQLYQAGIHNVVSSSGTALTQEQIRLINRLTPNVTVLFDGDAAGLRASIRGIDMILEQGMNVRICTFPDGEDPDSFAKAHELSEIKTYLSDNSKDFIQFKTYLLAQEAVNDPIKKAETIREIVQSIAKIPDVVKQELYVKSCAQIMDVTEEVLFATLAQLKAKVTVQEKKASKVFEVVKNSEPRVAVDALEVLERKLIELLLLYGETRQNFNSWQLQPDDKGEINLVAVPVEDVVYRKIFLDLQEDEIEFSNPIFKELYTYVINGFIQAAEEDGAFHKKMIEEAPQALAAIISSILMDEEKYHLHKWEDKNIYPKSKELGISQMVTETVLSLRCYLVGRLMDDLQNQTKEENLGDTTDLLQQVKDYHWLYSKLNAALNRVLG